MKVHYALTCILFSMHVVCAQQVDVTCGPERITDFKSYELGTTRRVGNCFYTARIQKHIVYLQKNTTDDLLTLSEQALPVVPGDHKKQLGARFREFKDNFIFFLTYQARHRRNVMYLQQVSKSGTPIGNPVEVGKRLRRHKNGGDFQLVYSPDSLLFAVITTPPLHSRAQEKFSVAIFDQHLKKMNSFDITLPYADGNFDILDMKMTREGSIYALAKITYATGNVGYTYNILKIAADDGKPTMCELTVEQKQIDQPHIMVNIHDQLTCFGFYTDVPDDRKHIHGWNGLYRFNLNSMHITHLHLEKFDDRMIADIRNEKAARPNKGFGNPFVLRNFFERPDGGAMVLFEEHTELKPGSTVIPSLMMPRGYYIHTRYQTLFENDNVLALNIDPQGKIIWHAIIQKHQETSGNDYAASFYAVYSNNKTFLIYNQIQDTPLGTALKGTLIGPHPAWVPTVAVIDESGHVEEKVLSDMIDSRYKFVLKPKSGYAISNNNIVFTSHRLVTNGAEGFESILTRRFCVVKIN